MKVLKVFTISIFAALIVTFLSIVIYHHQEQVTLAQYGPRTTATGREATVYLERSGVFHVYKLYVHIKETDGFEYNEDIIVKSGTEYSEDDMFNYFAEYVHKVKSGAYEH